jgi:hypothetical protein
MKNTEIITKVIAALEADKEHSYNTNYNEMLDTLDIGRPNESEPVDLDNIINNFKQSQEMALSHEQMMQQA